MHPSGAGRLSLKPQVLGQGAGDCEAGGEGPLGFWDCSLASRATEAGFFPPFLWGFAFPLYFASSSDQRKITTSFA